MEMTTKENEKEEEMMELATKDKHKKIKKKQLKRECVEKDEEETMEMTPKKEAMEKTKN